jgi:hypothetical protein
MGQERVKAESVKGQIWLMHFVYTYKNRTMKPIEIVLKGERRDEGE